MLILFLVVLAMGLTDAATLEKIAVLHRHGARSPLGVVNGGLVCEYPYCQLTDNGKAMCRSLGLYLQQEYNASSLLSFPSRYNVSFIASEATEYPRVVISAEAMIMGFYEGREPLPFVDFAPKTTDLRLCMWQSWPTWKIRSTYNHELHVDDAWVKALIGEDGLQMIGQYFGIESLCTADPTDCISFVQDFISCNVSSGAPVPSFLMNNWTVYRQVVSRFLGRILGYNRSSHYSTQVGSLGYPYVTSVLQYFSDPSAPLMRMKHSAAHDWTLIAVYSALGIWSVQDAGNERFVPRFAETLILERWQGDDGRQYVKGRWGFPDQAPGNHTYSFQVANLSCIDANGTLYKALDTAGQWCLQDDLERFVNTTAPLSSLGVCYASDNMLQNENCDGDAAPPVGSRCYFYRQHCPQAPCGQTDGAIADPARGLKCQTNQLGKDTPFLVATIVALVSPSLLAGAIGGFYFAAKIKNFLWGSKGTAEENKPIAQ